MLGFSTIYQATVKLALWQLRLSNRSRSDGARRRSIGVKAAGAASSAVGEGLADALNVGGI